MEMQFYFKNMNSSDALRNYAEAKIRDKVYKLSSKPVMAHVTFSLQPPKKKVQLHLHAGGGGNIEVEFIDDDMYAAIDKMIDKFDGKLRRHKERLKERLKGHHNIFVRARKLGDLFLGSYSRLTRFGKNVAAQIARPDETKEAPQNASLNASIDASDVLKLEAARLHVFHHSAS